MNWTPEQGFPLIDVPSHLLDESVLSHYMRAQQNRNAFALRYDLVLFLSREDDPRLLLFVSLRRLTSTRRDEKGETMLTMRSGEGARAQLFLSEKAINTELSDKLSTTSTVSHDQTSQNFKKSLYGR